MRISSKFELIAVLGVLIAALLLPLAAQALTMPGYDVQPRVLGDFTSCPSNLDINGDGIVNSLDLVVVLSHIGQNYPPADLNGDGIVTSADSGLLLSCWFATR